MNKAQPTHLEPPRPPKKWLSLCFFTVALLYHEALLRLFDNTIPFFSISLLSQV